MLVTSIVLNKIETTILIGSSEQLTETVLPSDATNKSIIWSTSDDSIATVSSDGLVTAIKIGVVTISATSVSTPSIHGNCKVTSLSITPKKEFARSDFKPDIFDLQIRQKGYNLVWEQSIFCSCYDQDSGQPNYNCPVCFGKGYVYFSPTQTKAIVTSINTGIEQQHSGLLEIGSAYMTPLSTDEMMYRDRVTFLDSTIRFSQLMYRNGENGMDDTRYKPIKIIRIQQLEKIFVPDEDYKISDNNRGIEWIKPDVEDSVYPLEDGSCYSIVYTTNPVYILLRPIHELRGTYTMAKALGEEKFINLPKQFMIKREDFLKEGDI